MKTFLNIDIRNKTGVSLFNAYPGPLKSRRQYPLSMQQDQSRRSKLRGNKGKRRIKLHA